MQIRSVNLLGGLSFGYAFMLAVPFLFGADYNLLAGALLLFVIYCLIRMRSSTALDYDRQVIIFSFLSLAYFFYFHIRLLMAGSLKHPVDSEYATFAFAGILLFGMLRLDPDVLLKRIAWLALPAIWIAFIWGLYEHMTVGKRVQLGNDNPLSFALYLGVAVHLMLAYWHEGSRNWKIMAFIAWILSFIIIAIFTESRGSTLLHFCGGYVFLLYVFYKDSLSWREKLQRFLIISFLVLAAAILALAIVMYFDLSDRIEGMIAYFQTKEHSTDASTSFHVQIWKNALANLKDVPFFGYGSLETFDIAVTDWPYKSRYGHLHSDILNHIYSGGVIGSLLYLSLMFFPLYLLTKSYNHTPRYFYFVAIIVGFMSFSGNTNRVFFHDTRITYLVFLLVFLVFLSNKNRKRAELAQSKNKQILP